MPGGDSYWRRIFRAWRCHLSEKPFDDLELDCKELMQSLNVCSTAFNCCDSRWCGHWRFIRWQMGLNLNVCQTSDHFQGKHQILALGWCIFTQWLDVSTSWTNIGCMRKRCHVEIVSQSRKGFPKKTGHSWMWSFSCDFHVWWGGVWRKGNAFQEGIATISNVDFIRMGFWSQFLGAKSWAKLKWGTCGEVFLKIL